MPTPDATTPRDALPFGRDADADGVPDYIAPTPDALDVEALEWLPRMRLMVDSGDYVGFPTADVKRLLDIVDRLDRAARGQQ